MLGLGSEYYLGADRIQYVKGSKRSIIAKKSKEISKIYTQILISQLPIRPQHLIPPRFPLQIRQPRRILTRLPSAHRSSAR